MFKLFCNKPYVPEEWKHVIPNSFDWLDKLKYNLVIDQAFIDEYKNLTDLEAKLDKISELISADIWEKPLETID